MAGRLFDKMVEYAREKGYKVNPSCPYIHAKFRRNPGEFGDLWTS
ncbi:MAG: N-acetyltransferase [Fermentimonas sp.]|nr:N-acetyltransferase [Fermentimonas sp.]